MTVRVASASESAARDAAAIESGIPSRALMRVAAANAATVIAATVISRHGKDRPDDGVTVCTGPGNNGGDGWAVAAALTRAGVTLDVFQVVEPRSAEAKAEREAAGALPTAGDCTRSIIVDAVLGTGSSGAPRGAVADAVRRIRQAQSRGAFIVALDVPTGLDATTGTVSDSVRADLTISFGTCKRGTLVSRAACGEIAVVDIGLSDIAEDPLPVLVDGAYARANAPAIPADANKGTRKSVAVIAGAERMGGAAIIASIGALRSGAGLVKVVTAPNNLPSVHARIPEALAAPLDDAVDAVRGWADVVLIGPGLGHDEVARKLITDVLTQWRGPIVVDADALNVFDSNIDALASLLNGRPAIITPHPGEFARLTGSDVPSVLADRFDAGLPIARLLGATVLLKGTPTVVTAPDGARLVVAAGTPVLATGGSGDALGGMIATLLAQGAAPLQAAATAAWVHGRAAGLVGGVRGFTIEDVLARLPQAWNFDAADPDAEPQYPLLASLPAVS